MSRRIAFPVLVLVVALGLMWLERRQGADGDGTPAGPAALERAAEATQAELAAPVPVVRKDVLPGTSDESQRGEPAPQPDGAPMTAPDPRATWLVRGIVLDTEGAPVPGLVLVVLPEGSCAGPYDTLARALASAGDGAARSGPDGRFTLEADTRRCEVFATGPEWATLYAGRAEAWAAEEEIVVVVAAPMQQTGRVVDTSNVRVVGAALSIYDQEGTGLPGFKRPLVRCVRVGPRWTTGEDGAFDLTGFTWIPGRRVDVDHERHVRTHFYPEGQARNDWLVVMDRRPEQPVGELWLRSEPVLYGVVRYADGRPAPGAHVRFMGSEARTDSNGRWELERPGHVLSSVALVAVAEGAGPAVLRDARSWSRGGERIGPIELTLTERSLSLRGRVIDARGAPRPGMQARLKDSTLVDQTAAGSVSLEQGLAPDAAWPTTDADGRFVLHGLLDREYTVFAFDAETSLVISALARPSDDELTLVVPEDALVEELEGVVLDERGEPVRGIEVAVVVGLELHTSGGAMIGSHRADPRATTGADGSFRLQRVPRRGVSLSFKSESIRAHRLAPGDAGFGAGRLEVRVTRSRLVRIDVREHDPLPTAVRFLDSSGGRAIVQVISTGNSDFDLPLHDGRSEIVSAPQTAAVAVLLRNEVEVGRIDLALQPGVVNVVGE